MHYSPVRRSSAGSKLPLLPLDLHVLGLPPAFNLSHDQTLQLKSFMSFDSSMNSEFILISFDIELTVPKQLINKLLLLVTQFSIETLICLPYLAN